MAWFDMTGPERGATLPSRGIWTRRRWSAWLGLAAVELATALWGYANIVLAQVEQVVSPTALLVLRYTLAFLCLAPAILRWRWNGRDALLGLATGALLGGSVWAQLWAMRSLPVDLVAFIMGLYVVFTPLAAAIIRRRWPSVRVWWAVALSVAGVVLLLGHVSFEARIGLAAALLAAVGFTGQIMGTAALTQRMPAVPATALETLGAALVMALAGSAGGRVWEDIGHGALHWPLWVWLGILYLAVLAQAGACLLQVWGQRHISATEAALAFNVEPVWTVWFAWLILGETLVWRQWLGAALILASVCIVSLPGSDDRG